MDAIRIIEALGGKHSLAALTGATPNAITQWRRIGVPAKFWPVLVDHAAAHDIPGITFDALRASKPASEPAAA